MQVPFRYFFKTLRFRLNFRTFSTQFKQFSPTFPHGISLKINLFITLMQKVPKKNEVSPFARTFRTNLFLIYGVNCHLNENFPDFSWKNMKILPVTVEKPLKEHQNTERFLYSDNRPWISVSNKLSKLADAICYFW